MEQHREGERYPEIQPDAWRRALRCANSSCVEVAVSSGEVLVRDGKEADGPILSFTFNEWLTFVAGVKAGDFDDVD